MIIKKPKLYVLECDETEYNTILDSLHSAATDSRLETSNNIFIDRVNKMHDDMKAYAYKR